MVPAPGRQCAPLEVRCPPLFMDTRDEATSGSESEAAGDRRGTKRRRMKNRNAARKSRKKQTERADELHKEFVSLEASNLALEKEIETLKKEVRHYTAALERHRPFCVLGDSVQVDALKPSAFNTSNPEIGENPHPWPLSNIIPSCLLSLTPHSLLGGNINTESCHLPSPPFTTRNDDLSIASGIFQYESPSVFDQSDSSQETTPVTSLLSISPNTSDGFFPSNTPSLGPSLSEFLEENDWILSVDGNPTIL
ncbi:basic leucine zipper transcriptional factor ATF-like 2 [Hippocampus zosterae]|uniref:basic leucine zipper transcriptional factor ATF-like 2 n=1 Tax=Hippocampus zosterae TaxID=109293 RepID=UPI00223E2650|nr:basic leucine zipper transcriptional factor ATF-like 2 [Hippocampus zosterae]XP_051924363.1 basic leucine zipper transcriptional factor ATF-like 2 [Hippocampus zosterae]